MHSNDEANWVHAATLAERVAADGCGETATVAMDDRTEYRLREWKRQAPFSDPSYFERRLAFDNLTEPHLRQLLGEPVEALQRRLVEPPPWLTRVRMALISPHADCIRALLPERLKGKPTIGFLAAADSIVEHALADFEKGRAGLVRRFTSPPFDSSTLAKILFPGLADSLLDMLTQTMVLELNIARLEGMLEGETAEKRFHSFVERFHKPEPVRAFFRDYPVLARLLIEQADRWVDVSLELLERLCVDWTAIRSAFAPEADPGVLVGAAGGLADPHCGGRSVVILKFSSGIRIVYKPKSLAVDVHFQNLLQWLNARGAQPPFKTLTVLDRGPYGWAEYIETRECRTAEEVQRFYERQGAYVALLYVLDGTDFHSGNLIASGEHPVLVDLEALFHPRRPRSEPSEPVADRIVRRTISNSVLSIDLLPERVWSNSENEGVDMSGLGTPEGQITPHPLPQWEATGTDTMHLVRRRRPIGTRNHRPKLAGAAVNVSDYRQAILDGFAATYSMLVTHRDDMLSDDGPLAPFHEDEVCVFLRSSRTYRRLLRESYHPDVLRDALDRERLFDLLWIEVERQPELLTVIRTEREDLLRGDIPMFLTRPGSRGLWTSHRELVPDFFGEASLSVVQCRLRSLGEEDFARQAWFIQASLSTLCPDGMDRSTYPAPSRRQEANREQFVGAAQAVGDRLNALAFRGETDASWIGVDLERDRVWSIAPSGLDLHGGVPGIALFLAYLGRVTGNENHGALARAALVTIRSLIDRRHSSLTRIGGFDGWGGLIYTLIHLGVLWDDAQLITEAESLVHSLPELIDQDAILDVEGGAAGCILALCCLHQFAPSDRLASVAVRCGDHLLTRSEPMGAGIGWRPGLDQSRPLAGFAHGAAGIALALLRLYAWTGFERFRAAAFGAWAYERGLFVEEAGNWPDLREHVQLGSAGEDKRSGFSTAWCHGAPGIGLARIRSLDVIDDADVRAEIAVALETTLREGFGRNHSLCHGDLGNLEVLFQASRILGESRRDGELDRLAARVLDSIETNGWQSGVPFGVETPGLMAGLAGIGYGMLRLAAPDSVPSVLTLEPPCSSRRLSERR